MRSANIFLIIASVLGITKGYEVTCDTFYEIKETDIDCLQIVNDNEISLNLFNTLNPNVNCGELYVGLNVCVSGNIKISSDGTCGPKKGSCPFGECCSKDGYCGTSEMYCGVGCNSKYGTCGLQNESEYLDEIDENGIQIDYDQKAIDDISNLLSMSKSEAKEFYNTANKAIAFYDKAYIDSVDSNLSVTRCQKKCSRAYNKFEKLINSNDNNFDIGFYNKYLYSINQDPITNEGLLELCNNKCYVIEELNKYVEEHIEDDESDESESDGEPLKKRSCSHQPSEAVISVTYNYLNGYNRYVQAPESVPTALSKVNGCSIPVLNEIYNSSNYGLFVPACNSHDICYGCQGGKSVCDSRFLSNMKSICKKLKNNSIGCITEAQIFYTAVKIGAQKNYDACKDNEIDPECAYCGASLIQNTLLYNPYYIS